MAKQRKIGAIIALDGEREFKTAVTSCNKSLATMKSEMKLVSAQTTGSANTLEALRKKHDVLQRTLDEQVKKEEAVRKGLEHAQEDYNRVGSELEQYKTKLSKAQETLKKMEESQDTTKEAMVEQQKVVSELSTTVEKGEVSYQKAESRVQDWKKSLNNAEAQTITATRALNENSAYMQEAEKSADGCATSIDAFGKQVNVAAEATDNLNTSVNKIFVTEKIGEIADNISGKMRDLASSAYDAAKELDEGYDTIVTKTGATGKALESLQESANNVFGDMPADMQDVGTAIGEVNTRFGQTGKVLEDTSKQFMKFAEINDTDLNESIDVSDRIMEQFGITTEQTSGFLGLLTQRGQETGKSVTELMSQLDSNAALFKELDLSVEESANLLAIFETNGVDAGVALKGLKTATNNYAKEGLSARQGLEKTIDRIKKAKTSTEALALAQDTFGSKGAQVMADGIREGRISLDDLSDSMDNYKNVVEDTFETTLDPWDKATIAANNLKTAGSELVGEFFEVVAPAIDTATDTVKKISKEFRELPEPVKEATAVVGAVGAAAGIAGPQILKVYTAVKTLKTASEAGKAIETLTTAQTAMTVATEGATVAQSGFNLAMLANPATLVVGGIVALTTALVVFSKNTETAKDSTHELADAADDVNESAGKAAKALNKATDDIKDAVSGNAASEATAYKLVDELDALTSETKLTTAEQNRMKTVVGELNTMFPDMGLEIDSVSGKLNMGSEEMKNYIKNSLEMAKIEAVQKAVKETTEKLVDAEIEQTKSEQQLQKTTDALNEIQKKREEAEQAVIDKQKEREEAQRKLNDAEYTGTETAEELMTKIYDTSEAQIEYNGVLMTVSDACMKMSEDEQILTEKKGEQEEAQKKLNDSVNDAQEEINTYTEYIESNTAAAESNTDATDANTDAVNTNTEAVEQQQAAASLSIETAGQQLEAFNSLSQAQQTLATDVTNAVLTMQESVQNSLDSQMNMFEEFNAGTEISKDTLLSNMQSQIDGVRNWEQNLTELAEKGVDEGLLQKLADMGPEGSTYVQAFNSMTTDELAKANDLWKQSVDIKSMSEQWGQDLTQAVGELAAGGETAWQELGQSMNMQANESGKYTVQGLVQGMQEAQKQATEEGEDLGIKTIDSINKASGVASPSKKTRQSGRYIVSGLTLGIKDSKSTAVNMAVELGNDTVKAIYNALQRGNPRVKTIAAAIGTNATRSMTKSVDTNAIYNTGLNMAYGLANGITAGRSSVINAVANMCASAVNEARSRLDIHSPSKVFEKIGSYTAEGFGIGYENKMEDINGTIRESMSYPDNLQRQTQTRNTAVPEKTMDALMEYLPYLQIIAEKKYMAYVDQNQAVDALGEKISNNTALRTRRMR